MIARTWRGETAATDADAYVAYLETTGLPGYRTTPGNRGAYLLRRDAGRAHGVRDAVVLGRPVRRSEAFAGPDIDVAVFYPEDDRFLTARDLTAFHYEVASPSPGH